MAKRQGILCKLETKLVVHKEWKDYHFELNLANFQYFKLGEVSSFCVRALFAGPLRICNYTSIHFVYTVQQTEEASSCV